jgi:cytochrome c-type biogenesis protein CcmH
MSSRLITRAVQTLVVCIAMITMLGANDTSTRYERVGHNMMCACSCGQILLECNHVGCPDSARMIDELRTQVATGANDASVMNWFVAKYGAIILASPVRGGFDNVAWITPIALFLLAIIGTAVLVRVWRARSLRTATPAPSIQIPGLNRTQADTLRDRIRRETEY